MLLILLIYYAVVNSNVTHFNCVNAYLYTADGVRSERKA